MGNKKIGIKMGNLPKHGLQMKGTNKIKQHTET